MIARYNFIVNLSRPILNPMKATLKIFIFLMIFSSVAFSAYGQKRSSKTTPEPPVPSIDSSLVMKMIRDNSLYDNVKYFGAKGDSTTVNTEAINKAIDAAISAGGGTVYFPAGEYLTFSIHLKSNITLFLDNGEYLIAAPSEKGIGGYDAPEPNVKCATFTNVKAQHAKDVPTFVLKNVTDFKTVQYGTLPDKKIDKADNLKL